jgi:selenocysteine lyase/cysteine desulfurase/short-subunit dehydrogenase
MENKIKIFKSNIERKENELFLNFAATAPLHRQTILTMKEAVDKMQYPLGQYIYNALNELEFTRRDFAELINAHPKEIAFVQNTSTALSMIALGLDWKPGDKILVPNNEFPSNYYPWLNLKKKGVICENFTPKKNESITDTLKKIDLTNVKLISISAVSYETGILYDLEGFTKFCKERNIYSCLDAIQAIGAVPIDVKKNDVDFMASGAQKWLLGPIGCGMLFVKAIHLEKMNVPFVGWTSVEYPEYLDLKDLTFSNEMTRFEPGLPGHLPILGTHTALKLLNEVGFKNIYAQIAKNTKYLTENLKSMNLELLLGDNDLSAGIISFSSPLKIHARDLQALFEKEKIKVTTRNNYIRVAPHFINDESDLNRFLETSEKIFNKKPRIVKNISLPLPDLTKNEKNIIIVTGASGAIGKTMTKELSTKGFKLILVTKTTESMEKLKNDFPNNDFLFMSCDFNDQNQIETFSILLKTQYQNKIYAYINCAGIAPAGPFHEEELSSWKETTQVNSTAPMELMYLFLNHLKSPNALGVLNFVSSTGRCGSPILSAYSASQAALWTLTESLSREYADKNLVFTTFVSPALHSPMQKRIGRIAIRYFRVTGSFDYSTPEYIVPKALSYFLKRRSYFLSPLNRTKILLNSIWPEKISSMIKKVWRH